jgi:hypothetical protein
MSGVRPPLEVADVIRRFAPALTGLSGSQQRILKDLAACRTSALGGHTEVCDRCRYPRVAYNSCRNRHCPKCQASACARWMADRARELLPVPYFHVVFTLPDEFNALALANRRVVYGRLFEAVKQTLLEVAAHPKRLGARIGFLAVLHTWGQNLCLHPHVHCVVPGGGLSGDGQRWIACRPGFFLPVRILSRVFRGKFLDQVRKAWAQGKLHGPPDAAAFEKLIAASVGHEWVVYAKPPFGGPAQVLKYLSRYTHRIAFSNRRLVSMDAQTVTFSYKDYTHHGRRRTLVLRGPEFLRRFLLHEVPRGFMRIRHFGLLAHRVRASNLQRCRQLLEPGADRLLPSMTEMLAVVPRDRELDLCPVCGRGHMIPTAPVLPQPHLLLGPKGWDSS